MSNVQTTQNLFTSLNRLRDFPLDQSSVYENLESAERYCTTDKRAYLGQMLGIYSGDDMGIYQIVFKSGSKQLLKLANSETVMESLRDIDEKLHNIDEFLKEENLDAYIDNSISGKYATKNELNDAINRIKGSDNISSKYDTLKEIADRLLEIDETLSFKIVQEVIDDSTKVPSSAAVKRELDKKQDKIQFIEIPIEAGPQGIIPEDKFNLIIDNKVNKLMYNGNIYTLSMISGNIRKYYTSFGIKLDNALDIDMTTAEYIIYSNTDEALTEHMNDSVVHITREEREAWNEKVTAYAEAIEDSEDARLVLTKNNRI